MVEYWEWGLGRIKVYSDDLSIRKFGIVHSRYYKGERLVGIDVIMPTAKKAVVEKHFGQKLSCLK